jgi:hypothetical protein
MEAAHPQRDVYEDFDPKNEPYFFRIGAHGLISFHGGNYHIRKRLSEEQRMHLLTGSDYVKIDAKCYVNLGKIRKIDKDGIYFGPETSGMKRLPISRRMRQLIRRRLSELNKNGAVHPTF